MLIKTTGRGPDYGKNLIQRRWAFLALLAVGATGLVCYFFLVPGSGISGHARGFYLGAPAASPAPHWPTCCATSGCSATRSGGKRPGFRRPTSAASVSPPRRPSWRGVATFFLQALAAFVLVAVDPMLVKVLLGSMLAYILFFLGARAALARRR